MFRDQSMPIVEMYEERDQVRKIDANQSPEQVYAKVIEAFEGYL